MEFHLEHPLSLHNNNEDEINNNDEDDKTIPISLFLVEFQHMPSSHYFHSLKSSASLLSNRNNAISSILQYSRKFNDPSLTYLAVNYLDRFLSNEDMPQQSKPWILKLISVSCVSLSAKMRKPEMSVYDLQVEIFDAHVIEKMENVILGALKWRMRSVTPFSFFAFFISLFEEELKEKDPLVLKHSLKSQAVDLTFNLQHDIKFLEFRPSVIAAASLLFASFEHCPLKFPCFSNRICQCTYVNKDELMECYKAIQERDHMIIEEDENEGSNETAVNVLDQQFSSFHEEEASITTSSSSSSSPKRRKTSTTIRRS